MLKYIYHHLGLGDGILLNGLIRTILASNTADTFVLFCKEHNYESISFMYHDVSRLKISKCKNDAEVVSYLKNKNNVIKIGFENVNRYGYIPFDETFYKQMNIPIENKWKKWYYKRDRENEEQRIFSSLGLYRDSEYIFVHDNTTSANGIKEEYLKDKRVIRPVVGLTNNIFDYVYTIENASEVHCIDSSFLALCDHISSYGKKYFHKYSRTHVPSIYNPDQFIASDWVVVE